MNNGENELSIGSNGSNSMFYGCKLDSVYIGRNISYNTTSSYGYSPFYNSNTLRVVNISDNETDIANFEFSGCKNLENITVPESITSIGRYAFYECKGLKKIDLPKKVKLVGDYAFSRCTNIESIEIPDSVATIGRYAFDNCSTIQSLQIPGATTSIGNYAFKGCEKLATVSFMDGKEELKLGSNGSSALFENCPLDSVYIGRNISYNTTSSYGYSPFYRKTTLRSVIIADKETEISANEFYGCTNLQNVQIGDGVKTIGDRAFSGCSSLGSFSFGTSLTSIGAEAFSDCNAMTKLTSHAKVPPTCGDQALDDINKWNCTLYVPAGFKEVYQQKDQWKDFFFIEENEIEVISGDANGDGLVDVGDIVAIVNKILGEPDDDFNDAAADINGDGQIDVDDIVAVVNIILEGGNQDAPAMRQYLIDLGFRF